MLFAKLLPREGNFFEMFNQHADRIVEAARAFSQLVANYSDPHLRDKYNQDVDNAERAADRVTHEVNKAIHKTFITPIDREQIHTLINTMDDVADLIQDSAETMALYDVRHMTEEITRLTDLSLKCCERLRDAVKLLDKIADPGMTKRIFENQKKAASLTEFKLYPDRSHWTCLEPGWEEVADFTLDWAVRAAA